MILDYIYHQLLLQITENEFNDVQFTKKIIYFKCLLN